ncbi:hypothetical protein GDO81_020283 [Engystomops pustulosus]|uniref:Uncharacterized protein n=1 Tax=Engystomops pustulosus TaxID=76066 RepID=A0AAV6YX93_ENGPU|nr:hypothetical protein GDO81_020283 [Engystomops pustulosus]
MWKCDVRRRIPPRERLHFVNFLSGGIGGILTPCCQWTICILRIFFFLVLQKSIFFIFRCTVLYKSLYNV